jgi:thymidine phosphorylase
LANLLVSVGNHLGILTTALLTDMNQPNGRLAGNAVEVNEALEVLAGVGPADVRELTLALGGELLAMTRAAGSREQARAQLVKRLDDGSALEKFRDMIRAQEGDLEAPRFVAPAHVVTSNRTGHVAAIDTEQLGMAIVELGGGRRKVGDRVDHSVGLEMLVRHGEQVEAGQPLVHVFAPPAQAVPMLTRVREAIVVADERPAPLPLIVERIGVPAPIDSEVEPRRVDSLPHAGAPPSHLQPRRQAPHSTDPS